ncbi:MAG: YihY/virulence factor BrkB family protein [Phycisphaerae bacterium]
MRIFDELRRRVKNLLTAPLAELGSWARFARGQITLWRYCARRLRENNVMAMSSALSFRTIFALVPLVIVAFLALKSLGVVEDSKRYLRDFLERSGMTQITYTEPGEDPPVPERKPPPPSEREDAPRPPGSVDDDLPGTPPYDVPERVTVAEKIESVVEYAESRLTVGRVGPLSVMVLVWTALTLLTTMERSLNRIFEAPRARGFARRTLIYWSALTLGPLVIVAAVRLGGGLVESVRNVPVLSWTLGPIGWIAPFVVGVLVVASLYTLMPNTRVSFRRALEGAVLAVPVWALARWAFALYVDRVGSQSIYGAMGLIPLFLLWLNLSWLIFLFGAQVSHAAANVEQLMRADAERDMRLTAWHDLAAVVAVAQIQTDRGGPATPADVAAALDCSQARAETLLGRLAKGGVLLRADAGDEAKADGDTEQVALAVPPASLPVTRVLGIHCPDGAVASEGRDTDVTRAVAEARRRAEAGIEGMTVADLLSQRHNDNDEQGMMNAG